MLCPTATSPRNAPFEAMSARFAGRRKSGNTMPATSATTTSIAIAPRDCTSAITCARRLATGAVA